MTASDELCLRFLTESGHFAEPELRAVRALWLADRQAEEGLTPFLVRGGIFVHGAAEQLVPREDSSSAVATLNQLFTSTGLQIFKQYLATAAALENTATLHGPDTVHGVPDEPKPATPSPAQAERLALAERVRAAAPNSATTATPPRDLPRRTDPPASPRSSPAIEPPSKSRARRTAARRTASQEFLHSSEMHGEVTLDGYKLQRFLGRGPKGLVYEAEDTLLGRRVAVKVLAPEMASRGKAWTERFIVEARLTSQIEHPLILSIFAFGRDRGLSFYVMPLMREGSAKYLLKKHGPLNATEATRIARHMAVALSVAHARGLSHGNLKPSNVFLGDGGTVRIADFTIPHLPLNQTQPTQLREQDVATDLRLLAATYHWLLTGRPPSSARGAVQVAASGSQPPLACAQIISKALSRKRGAGYSGAAALAQALAETEEALRGLETIHLQAPQESPQKKSASWAELVLPAASGQKLVEVGQVLGKCVITEKIGHGSSGLVYRANHQSLNIPVAVKVLHVAGESQIYRQLKSEARLLAQLNHPNIVRVWDFEDDPALPYLVLEFVEGKSLAELIQQSGRMPPDLAVQAIEQIAEGLAAAQKLGVVHRDVKPGNILLAKDGTAKLADLGLAVFVDSEKGPSTHGLAGTVAYMPPEQATRATNIDHRSDIYSLGASFYHLVTGQIPFQGATRMEVILKHAKEPPVPPHELLRGLPPLVSDVILKMMAKSPAERYQSYDELLLALHRLHAALAPEVESGTFRISQPAKDGPGAGQ